MECKKYERGTLVEQQSCGRVCRDEIETVQELGKSWDGAQCTRFLPKARVFEAVCTLHVCSHHEGSDRCSTPPQVTGARML